MDQHSKVKVKAVESTFEDALQASYFNSTNNGVKTTMFKVVEQTLGELDRSDRPPAVSEVEMRGFVQTASGAKIIVQPVLPYTGFIVTIGEIVDKLMNRADDEQCLHDIEVVSTRTASTDPFIKHVPPHLTRLSKMKSHSESHEELSCSRRHRRSLSRCSHLKKLVSKVSYLK